jgi:phosphatidylglycerophosphatase A
MSVKTETTEGEAASNAVRKPRIAYLAATALGLGYLPLGPGTWGSLGGIIVFVLPAFAWAVANLLSGGGLGLEEVQIANRSVDPFLFAGIFLAVITGCVGVWAASQSAAYAKKEDPQFVVIDEVSGQHLTLLLGCSFPHAASLLALNTNGALGSASYANPANWKYLLAGFILFRVFDVWKPFPARQAESLPSGWGIMADDWTAACYAAALLWIARAAGF